MACIQIYIIVNLKQHRGFRDHYLYVIEVSYDCPTFIRKYNFDQTLEETTRVWFIFFMKSIIF